MADYTPDPADVELIATATEQHHIALYRTDADGNSLCVCDQWADCADGPGWDEHMAEVALSALAAAGRLRPGPLLGVRTYDGRIYAPQDVVLVYATPPTEETP